MKSVQVLVVSDEGSEVTNWKAILNPLELQTEHKSIPEILSWPTMASDYDLVLIDSDNHQSAVALCSVVRTFCKGAILLYTNSYNESQLIAGYNAGADDYMVKPRSSQLLQAKVSTWCKRIEQVQPVNYT